MKRTKWDKMVPEHFETDKMVPKHIETDKMVPGQNCTPAGQCRGINKNTLKLEKAVNMIKKKHNTNMFPLHRKPHESLTLKVPTIIIISCASSSRIAKFPHRLTLEIPKRPLNQSSGKDEPLQQQLQQ